MVNPVTTTGEDVSPELFQVDPLSVEYSISVIADPPSVPSVKLRVNCPFPGVNESKVGALGVVAGVPEITFDDELVPIAFLALTAT